MCRHQTHMIEKYTPVSVDVRSSMPPSPARGRAAEAVVLFAIGSEGKSDKVRATVFEEHLDETARAALGAMLSGDAVSGKPNEIAQQVVDADSGRRLITVGIGRRGKATPHTFREAAGTVARAARKHRIARLVVVVHPGLHPDAPSELAAAVAGGLCTGYFKFDDFKGSGSRSDSAEPDTRLSVTLVVDGERLRESKRSVDDAVSVATAQNFARAVAAHPGNVMHPPALAELAGHAAKSSGLTFRALDEKQMQKLGMGGILAVGMGSGPTPPRMIVLEWHGAAQRRGAQGKGRAGGQPRPLMLVGKAITFDTGGISIKPREGMQRMVFDKCGAMAVLGAMLAIARLKLPVHVVGILAAAENHVSATAYRPGDILRMYNGVTVEVTNTDAEGRLVLADALAWGIETFKPAAVVDLATLTGGVVVALGKEFAGLISTNDGLSVEVSEAARSAGEKVWRLPLGEEVREMMKSDHADIVNSGGRWAHPLQGGEFLRRFIPEDGKGVPWVHLDIAGVADSEKDSPQYVRGATGWGVRTLVHWVAGRASR